MSTLRVSTIQDTAGSNSSTPAAIANGIAKAWVNFNGTGTVAIRAQYNVSSITDVGTGHYTVNFTTAMADADYAAMGCCRPTSGGSPHYVFAVESKDNQVRTTSAICFYFLNPTNQLANDVEVADIAIFR